jgi:hypothetical protein
MDMFLTYQHPQASMLVPKRKEDKRNMDFGVYYQYVQNKTRCVILKV